MCSRKKLFLNIVMTRVLTGLNSTWSNSFLFRLYVSLVFKYVFVAHLLHVLLLILFKVNCFFFFLKWWTMATLFPCFAFATIPWALKKCKESDILLFVFLFCCNGCSSWLGTVNAHSSLSASVGFKMLAQTVVSFTFVTPGPVVFHLNVQIAHSLCFYHKCVAFYFFYISDI